jgi:hypothetical protein
MMPGARKDDAPPTIVMRFHCPLFAASKNKGRPHVASALHQFFDCEKKSRYLPPLPFFPRRVATAADSAARPVPNRTTVTGSGIVTGPPGTGVTVATAVAVIGLSVPVGVGPPTGVFVAVGGCVVAVGVNVGGSAVGVSADGGSCARTTAGAAANAKSIITDNATRMPTREKLDRFIDRLLLMMTGASIQTLSKSRSRKFNSVSVLYQCCINARQT